MKKADLHSKTKGRLGEVSVAKSLMRKGLPVFIELGDNCKTDLITIYKDRAIKVQVKSYKRSPDKGSFVIYATKSGPNYKYRYKETDFDVFGIYLYETDEVYYVALKEVLKAKSGQIQIRLRPTKNGQKLGVRMASDYRAFGKAVRQSLAN